jgi:hypothetical protein
LLLAAALAGVPRGHLRVVLVEVPVLLRARMALGLLVLVVVQTEKVEHKPQVELVVAIVVDKRELRGATLWVVKALIKMV